MKLHTGERPFNCHVCERSFVSKQQLERHIETHIKHGTITATVSSNLTSTTHTASNSFAPTLASHTTRSDLSTCNTSM